MQKPQIGLADLIRRSRPAPSPPAAVPPLAEVTEFGPNPGGLRMLAHVPRGLPPGAPLVVALHGCGQDAAGYDAGCGWSALAEACGFALLLPEQRRGNNPQACFNWFEPAATGRDGTETLSICRMIDWMLQRHRLDPRRVQVTGLSAGGAMAAALLATRPELFAAGAIIAGLPFGAAQGLSQAFEAMATGRPRPAREWGELARRASGHCGPWPRVAIWQGEADTTVRPVNAEQLLRQWLDLHGLDPAAGEAAAGEAGRRVWRGAEGRVLVECRSLPGLAHGVPIQAGTAAGCAGRAGGAFLDVGLSSTHRIAGFFGLDGVGPGAMPPAASLAVPAPGVAWRAAGPAARWGADQPMPASPPPVEGFDPAGMIRWAWVAAGLLPP